MLSLCEGSGGEGYGIDSGRSCGTCVSVGASALSLLPQPTLDLMVCHIDVAVDKVADLLV